MVPTIKFDLRTFFDRLVPALVAALLAGFGLAVPAGLFPGCHRPEPPPPPGPGPTPPPDWKPTDDPVKAIGRLAMSGGFCSATVVGPPMADGRRTLVSAAHCVSRVGESVQFTSRDGAVGVRCSVVAIDRGADVSILTTDQPSPALPAVRVAERTPPVGTDILHAGFGQDVPGNVERGRVLSGVLPDRKVAYRLSVSPGDSGGGIMMTAGGELLSPVCCTTCLACTGDVYGGSPERVREMLTSPAAFIDLPPVSMPPAADLEKTLRGK